MKLEQEPQNTLKFGNSKEFNSLNSCQVVSRVDGYSKYPMTSNKGGWGNREFLFLQLGLKRLDDTEDLETNRSWVEMTRGLPDRNQEYAIESIVTVDGDPDRYAAPLHSSPLWLPADAC